MGNSKSGKKSLLAPVGGILILIGAFILMGMTTSGIKYILMLRPEIGFAFITGIIFAIIGILSFWLKQLQGYMRIIGIILIVLTLLFNVPIIIAPFYIIGGILFLFAKKKK